ncbi:MAG: response regulator [Anaerolineales bacterium]|nr:response regulator [Anaerolineales bacterium]
MKTALVVDESPRWRATLSDALRPQGWSVTAAASLAEVDRELKFHLAVLAVSPEKAAQHDAAACLARLDGAPTRCVLLASQPAAQFDPALAQHPRVLGLIEKGSFSPAALLDLAQSAAVSADAPEPPAGGPKVLVVEDDANWRAIYTELLGDAGYVLHFAVSYGEARGWLQHVNFELAVVDLNLASSAAPEGNRDGFFLLRAARQRGVPAVVVSALGDPEDIDRAYDEYDIFTFVEKEGFDGANFLRLLDAARRAGEPSGLPAPATGCETLTPREREVLALLTQGLTNRQIAEALLISANTTKKHVDHILQKLRASTRAGAVAAAMRLGNQ